MTVLNETICQTTCFDFATQCLEAPGIYTDTLFTQEGCDSVIFLILNTVHCPWLDQALFIPNSFSPNNDGLNDYFKAEGINFTSYQLSVFDRWGELVYNSNSLDAAWDGTFKGKPSELGIYAYFVKVTFINGNSLSEKGDVMLAR